MMNEDDKETARFKTEQNVLLAKIAAITPRIRECLWHEDTKKMLAFEGWSSYYPQSR